MLLGYLAYIPFRKDRRGIIIDTQRIKLAGLEDRIRLQRTG